MRYVSHSTRVGPPPARARDRKSTRLNSSHGQISYAVFCLKKKWGGQLPRREGMEFPVRVVPVDETLEVQGDRARRHLLCNRHVVAIRDRRSAVALGQPVLLELDGDVPVLLPHRTDVPGVVAERLIVRLGTA